jgi:hypothetical protein
MIDLLVEGIDRRGPVGDVHLRGVLVESSADTGGCI